MEVRTETCQLHVVFCFGLLFKKVAKAFFLKQTKGLPVYTPVSNTFTFLKLELLPRSEAEVIPVLLAVYMKAGVFDASAELPSGGSPSWERT